MDIIVFDFCRYVSDIPGNDGFSLVVCVHDSAANMKAAIPKCTYVDDSLLCADHLLNLVVENTIKGDKVSSNNESRSCHHQSHCIEFQVSPIKLGRAKD